MVKRKLWHHLLPVTPKAPRFPPNGSRIVEVLAYPSLKLLARCPHEEGID